MARKITVSATIDGLDHESNGYHEYGHAEFTRETILSDLQPQNVMSMYCRWGGECRVDLELTGQLLADDAVRVSGKALLFEGETEDSDDLDGQLEFVFLVPKGQRILNYQRVKNTDEGGDFADIRMAVTNMLVE